MKYEQIMTTIFERIQNNEYTVDYALPNQAELAEEFGVSRMTVKRAMDILIEEGHLYSSRGLGTFVSRNEKREKINEDKIAETNEKETKHVLTFERILSSEKEQKKLLLSNKQPVFNAHILRFKEGQPYSFEEWLIPEQVVPQLTLEILNNFFYHYITTDLDLKIGDTSYNIMAEKATMLVRKYLQSDEDTPILKVEKLSFLRNGCPFLHRICHYENTKKSYRFIKNINKRK